MLRRTSPELKQNVETAKECGTDLDVICMYLEKRGIFRFLEDIADKQGASGMNTYLMSLASSLAKSMPEEAHETWEDFMEALKNGDYGGRVHLRDGDAFQDLAEDLNELAALLERNEKRSD